MALLFWPTFPHRVVVQEYVPKNSYRRSRFLSWCLCVLAVIAVVFWAQPYAQPETAFLPRKPKHARPVQATRQGALMQLAKQGSLFQAAKPATAKKDTEHVYRPDGLLEVNPKGKHPIVELIERSDAQWKSKLDRQSKTLTQAVTEYRRRYKRSPPKGFEHWWNFVKTHNVKLVDEYDSIHEKFQPFWGVDPAALNKSQAILETLPDRFTIGKLPGEHSVKLLNQTFRKESRSGEHRIRDQLDLLESVQEWLPDFRATFSMHDGPTQVVGWELYSKAKEAAERGEYIDVEQVAASISAKGWAAACPPNAPIQSYDPPPLPAATLEATQPPAPPERLESPKPKSFIHDHNLSMSPCFHPSHMHLNGFLSRFHYRHQFGPEPTAFFTPTFSICVSPLHRDILTVAPEQYRDDVDEDPVWGDKVDTRLLWRGSNTGIAHGEGNDWNTSQRTRLVELGTRRGGETQVLLPPGGRAGDVSGWDAAAVGHGEPVRTSALNAAFMDVAFVGKPIQCDKSVCSQLQRMFEWRPFQPWRDAWVYKFIMDIDGNGWSARFKRLMTSKSLIFKSTIFPEWYTERIMPWVHYIPVQMDLSDIYDVLAFFRGDLSGAGAHDDLAERIATAGKTWSHEFYRRHDMAAYNIRLFLEYARVMSLDREAMTYKDGDEDGLDRR